MKIARSGVNGTLDRRPARTRLLSLLRAVDRALPVPLSLRTRLAAIAASRGLIPVRSLDGLLDQDRRSWLLGHVSLASQDGLEIGPLCSPLVKKGESGGRVSYVDFSTAAMSREKYKNDPNVRIDEIVEPDYLWGAQSLPELVDGRRFDYVVASHVIEHVPDMLGWLQEVASVLEDGGVLLLAIPDKRYTFDYKRDLTSLGTLVESFLLTRRRPGPRDVFDQVSLATRLDAREAWSGKLKPDTLQHHGTLESALERARECARSETYNDVHVNILTPTRFVTLLAQASRLGLCDFSLLSLRDTVYGSCEFLVSLQRLPRDRSREENLVFQLRSFGDGSGPGKRAP